MFLFEYKVMLYTIPLYDGKWWKLLKEGLLDVLIPLKMQTATFKDSTFNPCGGNAMFSRCQR